MHTRRHAILLLLTAVLVIGSAGTGWLLADQLAGKCIQAAASAPGTLPAADHRPPPWQVAPEPVPADTAPMLRDLHEIARTITCMVDGEVVKAVPTSRATEKAFAVDPRDPWAAADNWDYNHQPFRQVKQALQRAVCLAPGQVSCTLFMPSPVKPDHWHNLLGTAVSGKQMMTQGDPIAAKPDPELLQVFNTGSRVVVAKTPNEASVLTPIYDSLGQIVAVAEVFATQANYSEVRK